jgi:hypothetical protein
MGWPTDVDSCPTVDPWNVPRYWFEANRDVLRARASLIPYVCSPIRLDASAVLFCDTVSFIHALGWFCRYIYTQTSIAHLTGLGITRPMCKWLD